MKLLAIIMLQLLPSLYRLEEEQNFFTLFEHYIQSADEMAVKCPKSGKKEDPQLQVDKTLIIRQDTACYTGMSCSITCSYQTQSKHNAFRLRFIRGDKRTTRCNISNENEFKAPPVTKDVLIATCENSTCYSLFPYYYSLWTEITLYKAVTLSIVSYNPACDEGIWYCQDGPQGDLTMIKIETFVPPEGELILSCEKTEKAIRLSCSGITDLGSLGLIIYLNTLEGKNLYVSSTGSINGEIQNIPAGGFMCYACLEGANENATAVFYDVCFPGHDMIVHRYSRTIVTSSGGYPLLHWQHTWPASVTLFAVVFLEL